MEECIEVSHERMLGSSQNCHKDWRITVDNCHSLGCSVSELPLGNFSPFEALWVSLHRRWTFQILSFPHPMQLGACMWLRLGQAGPHAKNIKLRANDTKKHRPHKKKKKITSGTVSSHIKAQLPQTVVPKEPGQFPVPGSRRRQRRLQCGNHSNTTSKDLLQSVIWASFSWVACDQVLQPSW